MLAAVGGCFAVVVSSLVFRGWFSEGNVIDTVPCAVAVYLCWGCVSIAGQMPRRLSRWIVPAFVVLSIVVGKFLAWDLMGFIARMSAEPAPPGSSVIGRLVGQWQGMPRDQQWINGALYVASPLAAFLVIAAGGWLGQYGFRISATAPARSSTETEARQTSHDLRPLPRFGRLALAGWVISVGLIYAVLAGSDRTGFRMMTMPADEHHVVNPVLGFSVLVDQRPVMAETISAIEQVSWFSGSIRSDNNFRFLRAGYGFVAAQLAPLLGQRGALLAVNGLCWAFCLYAVWQVSLGWFASSRVAAIAMALAAPGLGFSIHVHDTVPHLLSFAMYFGGIWMLQSLELSTRIRPWRTHLIIGLTLGTMSLAYNVAQMLLLVYGLVSLRRQPWRYLIAAGLIALTFRPLWRWVLPALGINVVDAESEYLANAMAEWSAMWQAGPGAFAARVGGYMLEIVTSFETPWMLLLAIAGIGAYVAGLCQKTRASSYPSPPVFASRRGKRDPEEPLAATKTVGFPTGPRSHPSLLPAAAVIAPMLACIVFAPSATARGYIVFGASIVVYAFAAGWLGRRLRRGGIERWLGLTCLVIVLGAQLVWATSYAYGWIGPAKAYFLGWDDGWQSVWHGSPRVVSLTESVTVPYAFGGDAVFAAAGAIDTPAVAPIDRRSMILALLSRLPFIGVFALLVCVIWPTLATRRIGVAALLAWWVVSSGLAYATIRTEPVVFEDDGAVVILPGDCVTLRMLPDPKTLATLRESLERPGKELLLYTNPRETPSLEINWVVDDEPVELQPRDEPGWRSIDRTSWHAVLTGTTWTFEICNPAGAPAELAGWQRTGLPDRTLVAPKTLPVLPVVELRVLDSRTGFPELIAF